VRKIKSGRIIYLNETESNDSGHIDQIDDYNSKDGKIDTRHPCARIGINKAKEQANSGNSITAIHNFDTGSSRYTDHTAIEKYIFTKKGENSGTHRCDISGERFINESIWEYPKFINKIPYHVNGKNFYQKPGYIRTKQRHLFFNKPFMFKLIVYNKKKVDLVLRRMILIFDTNLIVNV